MFFNNPFVYLFAVYIQHNNTIHIIYITAVYYMFICYIFMYCIFYIIVCYLLFVVYFALPIVYTFIFKNPKEIKIQLIVTMLGSLWFEHNNSSTQMRRLTNLALTRILIIKYIYDDFREYPIWTDVINLTK